MIVSALLLLRAGSVRCRPEAFEDVATEDDDAFPNPPTTTLEPASASACVGASCTSTSTLGVLVLSRFLDGGIRSKVLKVYTNARRWPECNSVFISIFRGQAAAKWSGLLRSSTKVGRWKPRVLEVHLQGGCSEWYCV